MCTPHVSTVIGAVGVRLGSGGKIEPPGLPGDVAPPVPDPAPVAEPELGGVLTPPLDLLGVAGSALLGDVDGDVDGLVEPGCWPGAAGVTGLHAVSQGSGPSSSLAVFARQLHHIS